MVSKSDDMTFNEYIQAEYPEGNGCGWVIIKCIVTVIIGIVLFSLVSCRSVQIKEKVEYRDSTIVHHVTDTTRVTVNDTTHIEVHHVVTTEQGTTITFGQGGGTYNSKTGEATNVTGVQEHSSTTEQEDIIADLRTQLEVYKVTNDSLLQQITNYASELEQEREKPKRSGYDRFCSWWFVITAILLLLKLAVWVCEKIPTTAPYAVMIRKFVPFL